MPTYKGRYTDYFMPSAIQTDPLLAEIETLLDIYNVSVSKFGYHVAGDPALVSKLRKGRRVRKTKLRDKITQALDNLAVKGTLG